MRLLTFTGIYDNPVTMRREHWLKSKLMSCISPIIFMQKVFPYKMPAWSPGRVWRSVSN